MTENEIATITYNAALTVHKELGPGLLESSYEECLFKELFDYGLYIEKTKTITINI